MSMKNLVVRNAHFCANTSLKLNESKFLTELTTRDAHADVGTIPVWVNGLQKECKKGAVVILQEVGQRRALVPTNRKVHGHRVFLSLRGSKVPFGLQYSDTSCPKLLHTVAMFRKSCNRFRLTCLRLTKCDFKISYSHWTSTSQQYYFWVAARGYL